MTESKLTPIGIDPASGKDSYIWSNYGPHEPVAAGEMRSEMGELLKTHGPCFIAWDAPLSFDQKASLSDRLIDKVTRQWVEKNVKNGSFARGAINALPFSGLSHWVISCHALGLPFAENCKSLVSLPPDNGDCDATKSYVGEVHPAVAMDCMWLDKKIAEPFPKYKGNESTKKDGGYTTTELDRAARRFIVETLEFPAEVHDKCVESDDNLDSYVAYCMARDFLSGAAKFASPPSAGSYILPMGDALEDLVGMIRDEPNFGKK